MSYPVYYVPAGDVLPILFGTYDGGTGASLTMTGLAVTDIEIYKDGSTTQRASDAGYTLLDTDGIDFDSLTGIHGFSIDTGDNTDAGFYTVGAWFHVVVSAITVDSQTVSFVAAAFRIMAAEGVAGVPDVNVTHVADTAQTANDNGADINAILADTNELQTDWANGGRLDLILDARASQASVDTIDTNVDSILVDTAEIGAAGAGLTEAGGTGDHLTALATQASVNTIDDLLDTEIAAILAAVDTEVAAIKAKTDQLTFTVANQVDANALTVVGTADDAVLAAIAALNDITVANILAATVEGSTTLVQTLRLLNAALGGKASGLETTTAVYRDIGDTKDRITATVDADGNRSAVTLDLT